ncbi:hypothetical protein TNCV_3145901 [Trichonephila clavipes]|nr:hypothetical protein TNCV_3145901 [Trichonephila clavipes]
MQRFEGVFPRLLWLDSPACLGFLNKSFQASLLPDSVLQFLVLKTIGSYSRSSIQDSACLVSVANWLGFEDLVWSSYILTTWPAHLNRCILMKLTI